MKKWIIWLLIPVWCVVSCSASAELSDFDIALQGEKTKVILDCDMGYLNDDAWCMGMLAQADAAGWIDLLGITSVGGNTLCAYGTNAILNQLERIGRTDIPVYIGTDVPLMGFRDLEKDMPVTGGFMYTGAYALLDRYVSPGSYHDLGALYDAEWGYSAGSAQEKHAVDFMIEQVRRYPGQVTIFAIGACTNVALACRMDPDFAKNCAGIVYMGGAIEVPGNSNACGEFNWFYDPEAAQICLTAGFPCQTIVPDDISYTVRFAADVADMLQKKNGTPISRLFADGICPAYRDYPDMENPCWDPITAGIFLCPDLITRAEERDVAVDCSRNGYSYANAVTWQSGSGPYSSGNCRIVFEIDRDAFWVFATDLLGTDFSR